MPPPTRIVAATAHLGLAVGYAALARSGRLDGSWLAGIGLALLALILSRSSPAGEPGRPCRIGPWIALSLLPLAARLGREIGTHPCRCDPLWDFAAVAATLALGRFMPLLWVGAAGCGLVLGTLIDLTPSGLRAGPLWNPLQPVPTLTVLVPVLAMALSRCLAPLKRSRTATVCLAAVVLGTGLTWTGRIEVPALLTLVNLRGDRAERVAGWAFERLVGRGDAEALGRLAQRVTDRRIWTVHDRLQERFADTARRMFQRQLTAPELQVSRSALVHLASLGGLASDEPFLAALADHRVFWPAGTGASPLPPPTAAIEALLSGAREKWYPATVLLVMAPDAAEHGRRRRSVGQPLPGGLAAAVSELVGDGGETGTMATSALELLWHPAEGVRLAAAAALAARSRRSGVSGEEAYQVRIYESALAAEIPAVSRAAGERRDATAPLRAVLFTSLLGRDRLPTRTLEAALSDPLAPIAGLAGLALAARGESRALGSIRRRLDEARSTLGADAPPSLLLWAPWDLWAARRSVSGWAALPHLDLTTDQRGQVALALAHAAQALGDRAAGGLIEGELARFDPLSSARRRLEAPGAKTAPGRRRPGPVVRGIR